MASNSEGGTRKLAAIMFTDVKDFSKKMGENEVAAMEVLRTHDDTMREIVAKHHGVVIKVIGDSFMVDFSSAVNAVKCAIEAQERFWEYNKGKSEFESIQIRVGVHLGDVIIVGNDIYGDGVNIAARIQAITEATRICISAEIYNQVKNKFPIKVYSIGETDLKNIAEPVEVFEILLESIPELATPSKSAQSIPTLKRAEQISKQEQEEAKKVEETRRKIDAEETERRERADVHYKKALEYFQADDVAKAEEEIKEVYKIVQIHYESQMLLIQVEERRSQLEEEDRKRRVKEEKLRKEEERKQRIQRILDNAIQFVEQEKFAEALGALQEVYGLEPNNEQAKRIEKQLQLAEEARLERERQAAQAEEERQREEAARLAQQRAQELAEAALQRAAARKEAKEAPKSKRAIIVGGILGVLVIAAVAIYVFTQGPLAKPSGVAVLPFTVAQTDDPSSGEAFSILLSRHIGRIEGMSVLAPTSSRVVGTANAQQLGSLGVSHLVRGSLTLTGSTVSIQASCVELSEGNTVWQTTIEGDLRDLNSLAGKATAALMNSLGSEIAEPSGTRISENQDAAIAYLRGLAFSGQPGKEALSQSISSYRDALLSDSLMMVARCGLSLALLEQYKQDGDRDATLLAEAASLAQMAVSSNPDDVYAHIALGEAAQLGQKFTVARTEIERALTLQPDLPDALRPLALLLLSEGKSDEALEKATKALATDPRGFKSPYVKGIIHLYKAQCEDINQRKPQAELASQLFDDAVKLGAPDSLLTFSYRVSTWLGGDQEDKIIAACQQEMGRADDKGKAFLNYELGRTYSLKGKLGESLSSLEQGIQSADRAVTQDPRDYRTLSYYALLMTRSGKSPETAGRLIQRAATLAPSSAMVHYWAARMYAIKKQKAEALKELAKAVAIEYNFRQVLDADFLSVSTDPQFLATIARKTQ